MKQRLTWRRRAAAIWDASVRRQMRSYRRHAAASSARSSEPGARAGSVGRIASCASCAFFAFVLRQIPTLGKHRSRHRPACWTCALRVNLMSSLRGMRLPLQHKPSVT